MRPGLIAGIGIAAAAVLLAANPAAWGQPPDGAPGDDAAAGEQPAPDDPQSGQASSVAQARDEGPGADAPPRRSSGDVDSAHGDDPAAYLEDIVPDWVLGHWCSGRFHVTVDGDLSTVFTIVGWGHEIRSHWTRSWHPYWAGPEPYVEGVSGHPDLGRHPVVLQETDQDGGGRELLFAGGDDGVPDKMYRLRRTYLRC